MSSLSTTFPSPPWKGFLLLLGAILLIAGLSGPAVFSG